VGAKIPFVFAFCLVILQGLGALCGEFQF